MSGYRSAAWSSSNGWNTYVAAKFADSLVISRLLKAKLILAEA